ncbi:hypothetical protein HELRODRAFT_178770 [Helobdella robusta]|uniref:Uncharacterized protein n=1 Tax=Helobdella robusta TaxID=6412 RepID=T1FDP9_HELRO|nr:hypothetical protein HELRODRAFT_178770 [Helobdella robusta]ESN96966.1 hypothetical protein HELRODRAFT_178770 [Helobdella robusta]
MQFNYCRDILTISSSGLKSLKKRFSGAETPGKIFNKKGNPEKVETSENENILSGTETNVGERMFQPATAGTQSARTTFEARINENKHSLALRCSPIYRIMKQKLTQMLNSV